MRLKCVSVLLTLGVAAMSAQAAGKLIPREVLFGNPTRAGVQISHDGERISFLAPVDGVLNVWVGPIADPGGAKPVTHDTKRGIIQYFWAFTNQHIVYLQDKNGDENMHVYVLDLSSGDVKDLTPFEGVQARIQEVSYKHPHEVLIGLNNRVKMLHDIHRVDIETGADTLAVENKGVVAYLSDDDLRVRLGIAFDPEGGLVAGPLKDDGTLEPALTIGPEDTMTTGPVGFDKSGEKLYMMDSRGRNTAALVSMDVKTLKPTLIAEDPRVDIGGVEMHPTEKTVQAYSTEYERQEWHVLDKSVADDFDLLRSKLRGDFGIGSRTLDDSRWVVTDVVDDGPVSFYLYDRKAKSLQYLFSHRPELENLKLARMHPWVIPARDGRKLVSYVTLPVDSDPDGDGRPSKALPLVLWVHGGPWFRDSWGFNPIHQWLANRGYAVLSMNFRGSTGFGKAFINAADREWAGKMHNDIIDAVKWAVRRGIADPHKVAITGGSYGGYSVLVGLTFTPDVFACGVDMCGPSNLETFMRNIPEYWYPILPLLRARVGEYETEEGRAFLASRSPLTLVDKIERPLLIGQGANDPRVVQSESDQIVAAMESRGIPVTYVLYSDEGHGFQRPENSLSFWAVTEAFLAKHLGGACEPIGKAFQGSTIKVLEGADQVPALREALE